MCRPDSLRLWGGMGLLFGFFMLWGQRRVPVGILIAALVIILNLYHVVPTKIDRNIITFELLLWAGLLLEIPAEYLLGTIPDLVVWSWLVASIPLSIAFPFPLKATPYHQFPVLQDQSLRNRKGTP